MEIQIIHNIRFLNIGADPKRPKPLWVGRRQWTACVKYNFVSAGQNPIYSEPLDNLEVGDIIAAFSTGRGYVGIGRVKSKSIKIANFSFNGKVFNNGDFIIERDYITGKNVDNSTVEGLPYLRKSIFCNCNNKDTEFAVKIEWLKTVDSANAYWATNFGLFANPSIQSNLKNQPITIRYLETGFGVDFI
jgi:hypothetical protein